VFEHVPLAEVLAVVADQHDDRVLRPAVRAQRLQERVKPAVELELRGVVGEPSQLDAPGVSSRRPSV